MNKFRWFYLLAAFAHKKWSLCVRVFHLAYLVLGFFCASAARSLALPKQQRNQRKTNCSNVEFYAKYRGIFLFNALFYFRDHKAL